MRREDPDRVQRIDDGQVLYSFAGLRLGSQIDAANQVEPHARAAAQQQDLEQSDRDAKEAVVRALLRSACCARAREGRKVTRGFDLREGRIRRGGPLLASC